jgi:hypothetical protein
MTRTRVLRSALLAAVLPLGMAAFSTSDSSSAKLAARPPERLLVAADEFHLTLSRRRIAPGPALVQLANRGEDDHDLRLRRISRRPGIPIARWATTRPGGLAELELPLRTGRYRLWCSLSGHRALGMQAALRISTAR